MSSTVSHYGGLFGLQALLERQRIHFGTVVLDDAIDTRYKFEVYGIRDKVYGVNAVYAFAAAENTGLSIRYIGKAEILSERLSSHERLPEAVRKGANRLLVHIPTPVDRIGYLEAERRLIRRYSPPLNTQHVLADDLLQALLSIK